MRVEHGWYFLFLIDQVIPTLMLYGLACWLCYSGWLTRRPLLLVVAISPFVLWAVQRAHAEHQVAIADNTIKATRKAPMPEPRPTVLVLLGTQFLSLDTLSRLQGIKTVLRENRWATGSPFYESLDLTTLPPRKAWQKRGAVKWQPIAALPETYLLLRSGRDARYIMPGHYTRLGTPFSLEYVAAGREELLALQTNHSRDAVPIFPPVISAMIGQGWRRSHDLTTVEDERVAFTTFAEAALGIADAAPQ